MNVYLFRHGQKDSLPIEDPDLTSLGRQQAAQLVELMREGDLLKGTQFLTSPRIRAQNTFRFAAKFCKSPLQVTSDLDQRAPSENSNAFRARVQNLLDTLGEKFTKNDVVYLCSHHDWIEESISMIPADTDLLTPVYWSWAPAQYMHFEVINGLWILKTFSRIKS